MNTTDDISAVSYVLEWKIAAGNCSDTGGARIVGGRERHEAVYFTLQNGAQQPNLTAATASSASCTNISHFAFNLTDTMPVDPAETYGQRNTCAVFSDVQPLVAGDPCAVQLSSATASSILAALTASNCRVVDAVVNCESPSAGIRSWDPGYTGYIAGLGALAAAFVAVQLI